LCTRTTLEIDDTLLAAAKRRVTAKGTTFPAFVEHLSAVVPRLEGGS
jgi:hypothetical protein